MGAGSVQARPCPPALYPTVFHHLHSQAMEPCNGLCNNIFAWRVNMPGTGLQPVICERLATMADTLSDFGLDMPARLR